MTPERAAWRIVASTSVAATPWRNGGGMTRELARIPASHGGCAADGWRLRISVADIESDGPFSAFAGVERWFAVLSGAGVELAWEASSGPVRHVLTPASPALRFDGALAPGCRLLDGPTRDLNVMARRDAGESGLERATWHSTWRGPAGGGGASRGLFARVPLELHVGGAAVFALHADTLAWCEQPGGSEWAIVPEGGAPSPDAKSDGAPPGWWISLAPRPARAHAAGVDSA